MQTGQCSHSTSSSTLHLSIHFKGKPALSWVLLSRYSSDRSSRLCLGSRSTSSPASRSGQRRRFDGFMMDALMTSGSRMTRFLSSATCMSSLSRTGVLVWNGMSAVCATRERGHTAALCPASVASGPPVILCRFSSSESSLYHLC